MPDQLLNMSVFLKASPARVYAAWLDGREHGRMTGAPAKVVARRGGRFSAWDGYITGRTLELEPGRRIVQSWRSEEFPSDAADSRLEVVLEAEEDGTRLVLNHTEIPDDQGLRYRDGWVEFYFEPMQKYFEKAPARPRAAPKRKSSVKAPVTGRAAKTGAGRVAAKTSAAKKKRGAKAGRSRA